MKSRKNYVMNYMIKFTKISFFELTDIIAGKLTNKTPFEYYRIRSSVEDPLAVQFWPFSNSISETISEELYG